MRRKLSIPLSAVYVALIGVGCAGVEEQIRERARDEVDRQRQRVEKEIDRQRQRVEDEVKNQRQRVEKRVKEATRRLQEGQ